MSRVKLAIGLVLLGAVISASAVAIAGGGSKAKTRLSGFEEVPAIVTAGEGTFKARLDRTAPAINYELSYEGLEGGEVQQAHIHIGQRSVNGGIAAWLCDSATKPAPVGVDVPTCPQSGTVTGTITPADVQTIDAQGLRTTDTADARFADLLRALRAGAAYTNVHTATHGGGEIRGQLGKKHGHGHHNGGHHGDH